MSVRWTVGQMGSQAGKRFLVTGANSGVGFAAAAELVRHGAEVVLACRDRARGEQALARLRTLPGAGSAELVELDLASLASVRRVAEAEVARNQPLDGLINNAGVLALARRMETQDGFELQFGTNVLGHFVLTGELLPALKRAEAARVVTLASIAHKRGRINFDDLQHTRGYRGMEAYSQSKLGDLMFAFELERRLRAAGSRASSLAVHPGVAKTSLFKIGSGKGLAKVAERVVAATIGLTMNSEEDGAAPTLFAATAAEARGGGYYGPQSFQEMRGRVVAEAQVAPQARDQAAQARLWSACEELTGMRFL